MALLLPVVASHNDSVSGASFSCHLVRLLPMYSQRKLNIGEQPTCVVEKLLELHGIHVAVQRLCADIELPGTQVKLTASVLPADAVGMRLGRMWIRIVPVNPPTFTIDPQVLFQIGQPVFGAPQRLGHLEF
jgi:hypothetical protein